MTDHVPSAVAPNGMRLALSLAAVVAAAVGTFLVMRSEGGDVSGPQVAEFAAQCPRWARLAEELITIEGRAQDRCTLVSQTSDRYVFQAAPNIEIDVLLAAARGALENVRIRDLKSQASVTYNAEALALLK